MKMLKRRPSKKRAMIEPALTAEEWAEWMVRSGGLADSDARAYPLTAVSLYGQPFGFTRGDVVSLRMLAEAIDPGSPPAYLANLADRIEALLPPESVRTVRDEPSGHNRCRA